MYALGERRPFQLTVSAENPIKPTGKVKKGGINVENRIMTCIFLYLNTILKISKGNIFVI